MLSLYQSCYVSCMITFLAVVSPLASSTSSPFIYFSLPYFSLPGFTCSTFSGTLNQPSDLFTCFITFCLFHVLSFYPFLPPTPVSLPGFTCCTFSCTLTQHSHLFMQTFYHLYLSYPFPRSPLSTFASLPHVSQPALTYQLFLYSKSTF